MVPDQQVDTMIQQKSRSTFDTFRQTVRWEMTFNILFTLGAVGYTLVSELRRFPVICGLMFVIMTGFLVWQVSFYQRLRRHPVDHDVRGYLQSTLTLLKQYVLHYKIVYGVVTPLAGGVGFVLGFAAGQSEVELPILRLPENPWLAGLFVIAILVLTVVIVHLHLKYFYQNKIDRMQRLVDELESS